MEIFIGKSSNNDYRIDNPYVSRRHCKLVYEQGKLSIIDLDSTNGTFLNGERVTPHKKYHVVSNSQISLAGKVYLDWDVIQNYISSKTMRVNIDKSLDHPFKKSSSYNRNRDNSYRQSKPVAGQHSSKRQKQRYSEGANSKYEPRNKFNGMGKEMSYALHSNKSYIGGAFLTLLLYYVGLWLGGLIANILYLNQANKTKKIIGSSPSGRGCLVFLIWTHVYIPIIIIIILIVTGSSIINDILG